MQAVLKKVLMTKAPLKGDLNTMTDKIEVAEAGVHTCAEEVDSDSVYLHPDVEAKTVTLIERTVKYRVWLKEF